MKFIYLCGPTVYDKVHIGNMRPIVTFDLFIRATKHLGENITLIHNITDIDDKIITKSQELNLSEEEVSEKYFLFYKKMLSEFNINTIIEMPKVVDNIDIIIKSIEKLIQKNKAYVSCSVYFDTKSIDEYGSVSNRKTNDNNFSETHNPEKKNQEDFVLWKLKSDGVVWDSPWGKGRPGWHTECFSFIDVFGQGKISIHGGGIDLKFPHHENENSQFIGLHDRSITESWIHIGIMNFNGQKMSKSEKNILYADDFLAKDSFLNNSDVFRLILLNSNYKNVIEFTDDLYFKTKNKLKTIINIYNILCVEDNLVFAKLEDIQDVLKLVSDLNFSAAMKEINQKIKAFNENKTLKIGNEIISIFRVLGFSFTNNVILEADKEIYWLWKKESKNKNWKRSDELRNKISHILGQK